MEHLGRFKGLSSWGGLLKKCVAKNGGSGEIRTHGGRKPSPVFKTGAFNRSATLPSYFCLTSSLFAASLAANKRRPLIKNAKAA